MCRRSHRAPFGRFLLCPLRRGGQMFCRPTNRDLVVEKLSVEMANCVCSCGTRRRSSSANIGPCLQGMTRRGSFLEKTGAEHPGHARIACRYDWLADYRCKSGAFDPVRRRRRTVQAQVRTLHFWCGLHSSLYAHLDFLRLFETLCPGPDFTCQESKIQVRARKGRPSGDSR